MMKHYKISFLISVLLGVTLITNLSAQETDIIDSRVDSVFNTYFDFLTRDSSDIDTVDYDLQFKETEMAILIYNFFENISGHFLQRQLFNEHDYPKNGKSWYCYSTNNGFSSVCVIYMEEDFDFWKNWYADNKFLLTWTQDDKKINSKPSLDFYYIDYKQDYPSKIRFKAKVDWIPMTNKPKQVVDLEKQMDKAGLLEPKDGKIK
jgi:hypothetical protein